MNNQFPETYQMLVKYGELGLAFAECEPGETLDKCVQDIADGNIGGGEDTKVIAVYRTGLGIETKDVSEDVCSELMSNANHVHDLSSIAKRFLEENGYSDFVEDLNSFDPDEARERRLEYMRIGLI